MEDDDLSGGFISWFLSFAWAFTEIAIVTAHAMMGVAAVRASLNNETRIRIRLDPRSKCNSIKLISKIAKVVNCPAFNHQLVQTFFFPVCQPFDFVSLSSASPARCLVLRLCSCLEAIEFHFPLRQDDPLPKPIDVDYYPELDFLLQATTRKKTKLRKIFRFAPLVPISGIDVDIYGRVIWIG